jgi:hypothetical protein
LLVPLAVVTVTCTVPDPVGATTVIWAAESTVNEVAGVAPKLTAVAPVKSVPVKVTVVPPASGPAPGLIVVRVGGAPPGQGTQLQGPPVGMVICTVPVRVTVTPQTVDPALGNGKYV